MYTDADYAIRGHVLCNLNVDFVLTPDVAIDVMRDLQVFNINRTDNPMLKALRLQSKELRAAGFDEAAVTVEKYTNLMTGHHSMDYSTSEL